ncbi:MAG: hypothetical protein JWN84_883 [Nocardioides sp.]|nr:hypothetical protein [Nocardioides sp.]
MKLKVVVSGTVEATRLVDALSALGHVASTRTGLPGLVEVDLVDPSDAPTVQRIAAMVDHPSARAVSA